MTLVQLTVISYASQSHDLSREIVQKSRTLRGRELRSYVNTFTKLNAWKLRF